MIDKATKLPQCTRHKRTAKAWRVRCTNPGFAVWVTGEFGRMPAILCNQCIDAVRHIGWKVRYQIEGDNPPPLAQDTIPGA